MFDFQCRPASCADSVGPTVSGFADVVAQADCGNGNAVDRESSVEIGIPEPCFFPFTAFVSAEIVRDSFVDDCGFPDFIDTLEEDASAFDLFFDLVLSSHSDDDCTPSHSSETQGLIPCH
jgi:hypothetical protein